MARGRLPAGFMLRWQVSRRERSIRIAPMVTNESEHDTGTKTCSAAQLDQ